MLAANIRFMAEEDLHHLSHLVALLVAGLLAVFGLDELAYHRDFQRTHQVGHEHERIFQNAQSLDRLPLVVIGNVTRHFFHPLLDLLGGNYLAKWRNFPRVHQVACLLALALMWLLTWGQPPSAVCRAQLDFNTRTLDPLPVNRPQRLSNQHGFLSRFSA